jgi:hypothetical protein
MSFTISESFVLQFGANVMELAQQRVSRFKGHVYEDQITGEAAYLEQLAPTAARKVTARHADSPMMNSQWLRRRIAPYDYDWGDLIDRLDKVRLLIDPESHYTRNAGRALGRAYDDEIIAAGFGTAWAGHAGSIAITWPNGNTESNPAQPGGTQIAVNDWTFGNGSGNAGLTISKLISAKVALDQAEVDEDEERYLAATGRQLGNLLATTEATSSDYNTVKALVRGELDEFLGFKIIRSERLLVNALGQTRCMAWGRMGLGLGVAKDISPQAGPRPDKRFAQYIYCDMSIGAARLEEARVVEVICA